METTTPEPVDPAENPQQPTTDSKPKPKRRRWVTWLVLVLVVVTGLAVWLVYRSKSTNTSASATDQTTTNNSTDNANTTPVGDNGSTGTVERVTDEGVTWQKPTQLEDLGLIVKSNNKDIADAYEGTTYWQVGTTGDGGKLILARVAVMGMGTTYEEQYFWQSNGTAYYLKNNSDLIDYGNTPYKLDLANFKVKDGTLYLKSIVPDNEIVQGETRLLRGDKAISFLHQLDWDAVKQSLSTAQKIADTKWGPLYSQTSDLELTKTDSHIKGDVYFILLNDGTTVQYSVRPTWQRDDNTFDLASSNLPSDAVYTAAASSISGCGGGGYGSFVALNGLTWQENQQVATTKTGKALYTVVDPASPAAQAGLAIVNLGRGTDYAPAKTADEMITDKGIFFWVDDYGTTHVFMREDYQPAVECGKPVVYLYPTKDTPVTVKVGAKVRVSNPAYQNGWQGVAHPNGQITVAGQNYPYLFWEGKGNGAYPEIMAGRVVARADAVAQIQSDLGTIGLNQQEISDFLDFWAPKLPNTPYVRLTWLTNREMGQLAPLTITPQPDSTIRVFLDFAGLQEPTQIPVQQLPHYQRTGFTTVEWGGLLVGQN